MSVGHNIEVARQDDGAAGGQQRFRVLQEELEPGELVVELGPRLRVAVREVETGDHDALDGGLKVAGLAVVRIAGELAKNLDGLRAAG